MPLLFEKIGIVDLGIFQANLLLFYTSVDMSVFRRSHTSRYQDISHDPRRKPGVSGYWLRGAIRIIETLNDLSKWHDRLVL